MRQRHFDFGQDSLFPELLRQAVQRHWHHYSDCLIFYWSAKESDGVLMCDAAPALQEIVGGADDGGTVWSVFDFDLSGFIAESDIEIEAITIESLLAILDRMPGVNIRGRFQGQKFLLTVYFDPMPGSQPQDRLDYQTREVIPKRTEPS